MNQASRVFLGLGGNLGNVSETFRLCRSRLRANPEIITLRASSLYISKPWGGEERNLDDQPDYLNQVIQISTDMEPLALLRFTRRLELDFGREPDAPRWSARPLDIDILLYADRQLKTTGLQIPHPRMAERAFVLQPLMELDQSLTIPGMGGLKILFAALPEKERKSLQRVAV